MSAQDEGPKDDSAGKNRPNASDAEDHDHDRDAILARRKFMVLGALSGVILSTEACDTSIGRMIGRPFACLEPVMIETLDASSLGPTTPMPCLAYVPPPNPMPCLTPVAEPVDVLVVQPPSMPCLSVRPDWVEPTDAGVSTSVNRIRNRPHPCLSARIRPEGNPTPGLDLKPTDPDDES